MRLTAAASNAGDVRRENVRWKSETRFDLDLVLEKIRRKALGPKRLSEGRP
jgi:hypothetical protein